MKTKTKNQLKIAFVFYAYLGYRIPLFEKLSSEYNMHFFFEYFDSSFKRDTKHASKIRLNFLKRIKLTSKYFFSPSLFLYLIKGRYDVFIGGNIGEINTYITCLVARLLRKPFVFWDENWYWPSKKWRRFAWPIILWAINNSQAIVVSGSKSKEFYCAINYSIRRKTFVEPNVSLLPKSKEISSHTKVLRKSLKLNKKKIIVYYGRLIKVKGFEYLFEAFSKIQKHFPDAFLLVIGGVYGTGEKYSYEKLDNMRKVYGNDKVHFTGTLVDPNQKAAYLLLADVVVVPSIFAGDEYEVWGFVLNESMSMGKPVIATKAVGAAYDLIQNGINGFIVPEKDPESLFVAIKNILEDPLKQQTMGVNSLKLLETNFSYEHISMGFKNAIEFLLSKS
ncbi:MAG: glycosyltransferase family 4 protein [Candidatus Thermoplasmatota archaeon]|nr:glycosyltransferase family 4 protein [Candidatus Thermoplasmatota archaeon]